MITRLDANPDTPDRNRRNWQRFAQERETIVPFGMVKVAVDGGAAGSSSTTCSFTYTVTSTSGLVLLTAATPSMPRYANVEYETPADGSYGLAAVVDGALVLYEVQQERPKGGAC